jgi:predicted amidophosphoribosyltransferase
MNLCPDCGHDYDLDGRYVGFCHYEKNSDPELGFFRPVCFEGVEPILSPEYQEVLDKMCKQLSDQMRKTLDEVLEEIYVADCLC